MTYKSFSQVCVLFFHSLNCTLKSRGFFGLLGSVYHFLSCGSRFLYLRNLCLSLRPQKLYTFSSRVFRPMICFEVIGCGTLFFVVVFCFLPAGVQFSWHKPVLSLLSWSAPCWNSAPTAALTALGRVPVWHLPHFATWHQGGTSVGDRGLCVEGMSGPGGERGRNRIHRGSQAMQTWQSLGQPSTCQVSLHRAEWPRSWPTAPLLCSGLG